MFKIGVIAMALTVTLLGNWFTDLFDRTPTPPLHLPIDLSIAGSVVESKVRVKEDGGYYFTLEFLYKRGEVKNGIRDSVIARKLEGFNNYDPETGKQISSDSYEYMYKYFKKNGIILDKTYNGDGIVIPIRLIVYEIVSDKNKKLIKNKVYQTKGVGIGSSGRDFEKLSLKKGNYIIKVENIKAINEMQGRKANIRFGRYGNGK